MSKYAIVIHGGAGPGYPYLRKNFKAYEKGLENAAAAGYKKLQTGGSAQDAVEIAVRMLEDNELFNAGRGSCLNTLGEVEMDAAFMNGRNLKAGAVAMVRNVKNPISLARVIMNKTNHVFLSGYGALEIAKYEGLVLEKDSYFITEHQQQEYKKLSAKETVEQVLRKKIYGTVGAVAVDKRGNIAAGTSTGGTSNCLPGRVGDSCVIGAGCFADNKTCAVSGTGLGEYLIRGVVAHTISMFVERGMTIQQACDHVIHSRNKNIKGDIGVIAVTAKGEIGIAFNTKVMKRAWIAKNEKINVKIYK